jgi:hypothetical protein
MDGVGLLEGVVSHQHGAAHRLLFGQRGFDYYQFAAVRRLLTRDLIVACGRDDGMDQHGRKFPAWDVRPEPPAIAVRPARGGFLMRREFYSMSGNCHRQPHPVAVGHSTADTGVIPHF